MFRRWAPIPVSRFTITMNVFATFYTAFAIDWANEYTIPAGRPIKIANSPDETTAEPMRELL